MTSEPNQSAGSDAERDWRPGVAPEEEISLAAWRRRRKPLSRRAKAWIAVVVVAFLAVSVALARWLQAENVERDDEAALIGAQVRGDVHGMLDKLEGCSTRPGCAAALEANARNPRLLRRGAVKILQLESNTAYSLAGATGKTRLAWTVIGKLPVVQCVTVRRTGSFLTGIHVHLLALSAPISNEGVC